jgi:hypothetical protein
VSNYVASGLLRCRLAANVVQRLKVAEISVSVVPRGDMRHVCMAQLSKKLCIHTKRGPLRALSRTAMLHDIMTSLFELFSLSLSDSRDNMHPQTCRPYPLLGKLVGGFLLGVLIVWVES